MQARWYDGDTQQRVCHSFCARGESLARTLTSSLRGKIPGLAGKAELIPRKAIELPKPAPVSDRMTLSVNSCLTWQVSPLVRSAEPR